MNTVAKIQKMAQEIAAVVKEYRCGSEGIAELIEMYRGDAQLSTQETERLVKELFDLGVVEVALP